MGVRDYPLLSSLPNPCLHPLSSSSAKREGVGLACGTEEWVGAESGQEHLEQGHHARQSFPEGQEAGITHSETVGRM